MFALVVLLTYVVLSRSFFLATRRLWPSLLAAGLDSSGSYARYDSRQIGGQNLARVRLPALDAIYDRLQEITSEKSWLVMLGFWQQFWALSPRVQGLKPTFNGIGYFGDVWLAY